jgi:uncharacterized damage-inducible protein DinB
MEHKEQLHHYLRQGRDALLWKLEDLGDYDVRRPMTPTGTNLLGLVKHVASVGVGYFGECMGRPFDEAIPWFDEDAEPNADMWATAEQSREEVIGFWHRAWAHADATIAELPLETNGMVPWWPEQRREPSLHLLLVHMTAETHRHAGHADILRELLDGRVGHRADNSNLDEVDWPSYVERLEQVAQGFR